MRSKTCQRTNMTPVPAQTSSSSYNARARGAFSTLLFCLVGGEGSKKLFLRTCGRERVPLIGHRQSTAENSQYSRTCASVGASPSYPAVSCRCWRFKITLSDVGTQFTVPGDSGG